MSGAAVCVLLPWAGAVLAALLARRPAGRWVHVAASAVTLAAALALWGEQPGPGWLGDPVALGATALVVDGRLASVRLALASVAHAFLTAPPVPSACSPS